MLLLTTTCPDTETAQYLAEEALQARLVACANIHPGVISLYWWNGSIQNAEEVALDFKTTEGHREALVALVTDLHPYDQPVITWSILETTPDAADWVKRETRG